MGKPAAREGDLHECPQVDPVTDILHEGGVIGPGNRTVLIGGKAAATVGDACACFVGEPNTITGGSTGVFIGGKPAARVGDGCAHGGKVSSGLRSVLIGERVGEVKTEEWQEPSVEQKVKQINNAVKVAIKLLTKKLDLLETNDVNTAKKIKRWFGRNDDEAKEIIVERIKRELDVIRTLSIDNFIERPQAEMKERQYAEVYENDKLYRIFVGELFWNSKGTGRNSMPAVIIHELSHFDDVGGTKDYVYKNLCRRLAKTDPNSALFNADNFESFIVC